MRGDIAFWRRWLCDRHRQPDACKAFEGATAHEIGHCVKGAFYNRYATADNISQHEYRADKWAIENLIPKSELIKAIKKNLDSIYLLAQHFDVSEDFMIKACRYYGVYFG